MTKLYRFYPTVDHKARAALVKSDLPFDRRVASSNVTAKGSKLVLSNLTSALVLLFEKKIELSREKVTFKSPTTTHNTLS